MRALDHHYYRCWKCWEDLWAAGTKISGKNPWTNVVESDAPGHIIAEFIRRHYECEDFPNHPALEQFVFTVGR